MVCSCEHPDSFRVRHLETKFDIDFFGLSEDMQKTLDNQQCEKNCFEQLEILLHAVRRIELQEAASWLPWKEEILAILMLQIAGKCTLRYQNCSQYHYWKFKNEI